jgi:hypothetical protein
MQAVTPAVAVFLRSACRHCLGLGALAGLPAIAQDLSLDPGAAAFQAPRRGHRRGRPVGPDGPRGVRA